MRTLVAAMLAMCIGCVSGAPAAQPAPSPSVLTTAIGVNIDTFDPHAQSSATVSTLVEMVVEELVSIDSQGKVQPALATAWDTSSDGLTYHFTLRSGVQFSDGEPFNAAAVKFSLARLLNPNTLQATPRQLAVIKEVTADDDTHITLTLKNPYPPLLSQLWSPQAGIIAPNSVNATPNTPAKVQRPVGTGPYVLKDYVAGDHVLFERNPNYWGAKPAYDQQLFRISTDAAAREALFRSGQAQVVLLPPPADLPSFRSDSQTKVLLVPSNQAVFTVINTASQAQPLLQQATVRQALNYAVDKGAIVKNILFDTAVPVDSPYVPELFGYCSVGSYAYDAARARSMLQAAGAQNLHLNMIAPQGLYAADYQVAQAIANNLQQVGVNVDLANPIESATYISTIFVPPERAPADLHLLGVSPPVLDASGASNLFLASQIPPGGSNSSYYNSATVSALIGKANSETDSDQRQRDYCEVAKTVWNDAPWIFLYNQQIPILTSAKVTGFVPLPTGQLVTTWATPS